MNVNTRTVSPNGLTFIRSFEGFRPTSYQDQGGVWTIGYGSTLAVCPNQTITPVEAERRLVAHCKDICFMLNAFVTVLVTQNQFDALVSFCYNLGSSSLTHGGPNGSPSHLLACLNRGLFMEAACEFIRWDHLPNGDTAPGLTRRRMAERDMFVRPDVPSAEQPPVISSDV